MSKHTPGPWEIHDGGRFGEFGDSGPSICAVTGEGTCQPLFLLCGPTDPRECRAKHPGCLNEDAIDRYIMPAIREAKGEAT